MAKFLTTKGTSYAIEKLITDAKESLIIISPYMKVSKIIMSRLLAADKRGVNIIIVFRDREKSQILKNTFKQFEKINIYQHSDIHAKCYLNEEDAIVSSMNLYDYSERNNWEMSAVFNVEEDATPFTDIVDELKTIINGASLILGKGSHTLPSADSLEDFAQFLNTRHRREDFRYLKQLETRNLGEPEYYGYIVNKELIPNVHISFNGKRIEFELLTSKQIQDQIKRAVEKIGEETKVDNSRTRFFYNSTDTVTAYLSIDQRNTWENFSREKKFICWCDVLDEGKDLLSPFL